MPQKKYQRLQATNMAAAEIIYKALKSQKAISHETFSRLYCQRPGGAHRSGSFNNLIASTQKFLFDHGIMSTHIINGLIVYVATQKCFRTKNFKNATVEYQEVTNKNIDRAIAYQELNAGLVPDDIEGAVIANILELEGQTWKDFIQEYKWHMEYMRPKGEGVYGGFIGLKHGILSAVRDHHAIKVV